MGKFVYLYFILLAFISCKLEKEDVFLDCVELFSASYLNDCRNAIQIKGRGFFQDDKSKTDDKKAHVVVFDNMDTLYYGDFLHYNTAQDTDIIVVQTSFNPERMEIGVDFSNGRGCKDTERDMKLVPLRNPCIELSQAFYTNDCLTELQIVGNSFCDDASIYNVQLNGRKLEIESIKNTNNVDTMVVSIPDNLRRAGEVSVNINSFEACNSKISIDVTCSNISEIVVQRESKPPVVANCTCAGQLISIEGNFCDDLEYIVVFPNEDKDTTVRAIDEKLSMFVPTGAGSGDIEVRYKDFGGEACGGSQEEFEYLFKVKGVEVIDSNNTGLPFEDIGGVTVKSFNPNRITIWAVDEALEVHKIYRIIDTGETYVGDSFGSIGYDSLFPSLNGANFSDPVDIVAENGNCGRVFVVDQFNRQIRKIKGTQIFNLAGRLNSPFDTNENCDPNSCQSIFLNLSAITVSSDNRVYTASNGKIIQINLLDCESPTMCGYTTNIISNLGTLREVNIINEETVVNCLGDFGAPIEVTGMDIAGDNTLFLALRNRNNNKYFLRRFDVNLLTHVDLITIGEGYIVNDIMVDSEANIFFTSNTDIGVNYLPFYKGMYHGVHILGNGTAACPCDNNPTLNFAANPENLNLTLYEDGHKKILYIAEKDRIFKVVLN